jgi:FlaA1/EpsC-like NDP-sugar epimerase
MIKLSRTTTGTVLFLVDAILLLLSWPILLWTSRPSLATMVNPLVDARGVIYPLADLLLLFAMGLYRRDAIQNTARSLGRVPLIVGMGATLAILLSYLQSFLLPGAALPSGRDQLVMFGLAIASFTVGAFVARIAISILLRRHVLRRHLLIIGAGQRAWELLLILGREVRRDRRTAGRGSPEPYPATCRLQCRRRRGRDRCRSRDCCAG